MCKLMNQTWIDTYFEIMVLSHFYLLSPTHLIMTTVGERKLHHGQPQQQLLDEPLEPKRFTFGEHMTFSYISLMHPLCVICPKKVISCILWLVLFANNKTIMHIVWQKGKDRHLIHTVSHQLPTRKLSSVAYKEG